LSQAADHRLGQIAGACAALGPVLDGHGILGPGVDGLLADQLDLGVGVGGESG
jgi:hypothetical protein